MLGRVGSDQLLEQAIRYGLCLRHRPNALHDNDEAAGLVNGDRVGRSCVSCQSTRGGDQHVLRHLFSNPVAQSAQSIYLRHRNHEQVARGSMSS
jgi:hypothetical protein